MLWVMSDLACEEILIITTGPVPQTYSNINAHPDQAHGHLAAGPHMILWELHLSS